MITMITGLPGNGKTLYALQSTIERAAKENRQVYYSGIADLKIPGWIETDAMQWHKLPTGSIIVIDEVQRVMRPRQHGTNVPEFVAALETHRHLGVDLVLITQHPMLLDSNVRRLVGQHFHVVRKFGMQRATIHEWGAVKENADKNRDDSIRHEWTFPVDVFALYKSAELHTHKRRIPMRVWVLISLPLILGVIVWFLWVRIDPTKKKEQLQQSPQGSMMASGGGGGPARMTMTPAEYTAQFSPRVLGLAYTAPAYDKATEVTQAPYPAACVASAARCQCYTQQGTRLATTQDLCKDIAEGGFFVAWAKPVVQGVPVGQPGLASPVVPSFAASQPQMTAAAQLPGYASLGGSSTSHFTEQTRTRGGDDEAPNVQTVRRAPVGK